MSIEKSRLKFYILLCLILGVIIASIILHIQGFHINLYKYFLSLKSNRFLPLIYLLLYFVTSFFPIPFLTFLGATLFAFGEAFLLAMIGNTLFIVLMFYLTRWLGRDYVKNYEEKHSKLKKLDLDLEKHAFLYIFLLRICFIVPPEAVNIFAGLSKVKFRHYILPSILGTIPIVFVSTLLIKSYLIRDFFLVSSCLVLFVLMAIIPLFFIKGLRRYFWSGKKK
jgi:uncharacterized membrane protein YdjX (TVP38/TMEM64 family)